MFLLMFTYLFGGAVAGSTGDYLQYILPGHPRPVGPVHDGLLRRRAQHRHDEGRGRPLPLAADLAAGAARRRAARRQRPLRARRDRRSSCSALILGFGADGGVPRGRRGARPRRRLRVRRSRGCSRRSGLVLRSPNAVMNTGFMVHLPARVPQQHLRRAGDAAGGPGGVRGGQPDQHLVTATRDLFGGDGDAGRVLLVLGEAALLMAVFAPLTVRGCTAAPADRGRAGSSPDGHLTTRPLACRTCSTTTPPARRARSWRPRSTRASASSSARTRCSSACSSRCSPAATCCSRACPGSPRR